MIGNIAFIEKLFNMSYQDLLDVIKDWLDTRLINYSISDDEAKITGVDIVGSMRFGEPQDGSDLDVIVTYTGSLREDSFFNILDDPYDRLILETTDPTFGLVSVDFNPIQNGDLQYEVKKRSAFKKER